MESAERNITDQFEEAISRIIIKAEEARKADKTDEFERAVGEYCGLIEGFAMCIPNRRWNVRAQNIYSEIVGSEIIKPDQEEEEHV